MTVKIIEGYLIVASNCKDKLVKLVYDWSQLGYELHGSPFVNDEKKGEGQEICQAMVKYE